MFKGAVALVALFLLIGCSNNNNINIQNSNISEFEDDKKIYNSIYRAIASKNLDDADDSYIKLKTTYENSSFVNKAALDLAIVHMQKGEYILANFYLQDYLAQDPSSEFAKFLLVKNQFLSAVRNQRDQSYTNRALNALKINKDLVSSSEYQLLANSMLMRVTLDKAWQNKDIAMQYKRLKKDEAFRIYQEKVKELGVNINDIYKQ